MEGRLWEGRREGRHVTEGALWKEAYGRNAIRGEWSEDIFVITSSSSAVGKVDPCFPMDFCHRQHVE
jgi:hypothetical protein